jgi:transposase
MAVSYEEKKKFILECYNEKHMTRPEICDALSERFGLKIGTAYQAVYRVLHGEEFQVPAGKRRARGSVPVDKRTWNNRYSNRSSIDDDVDLSALS